MTTTVQVPRLDAAPPRRSRRRLLLAGLAVVVVVAAAVWVVVFSSVLGVRTVAVHGLTPADDVRGTTPLTVADVERAARISHDTPLVRLDTAAVTRRVEALPQVYSAEVTTSLPSTVSITVTERRPVAYVGSGGHFRLVDRTGARFEPVAAAPGTLPRLVYPGGAAGRATGAALATVAAALPASLLPQVRSVQALAPDAITLVLTRGRIVHWGSGRSASSDAVKARILPVMLRRRGQTLFDVSDPAQPFSR